jgi:hypothetical protein
MVVSDEGKVHKKKWACEFYEDERKRTAEEVSIA